MKPLFQRKSGSSDDNIIPLINVVFLLLIFFMVAGKITPNHARAVDLPVSQSQLPVTEVAIAIEIDAGGHLALNGVPVLQETLSTQLSNALAAATGESRVSVIVKADASLEARQLTPVMDIIRSAGVQRIRLFTRSGDIT